MAQGRAWETPRVVAGIEEIADEYDAFLVDSYGVLHDGKTLFAGAPDCLAELRRRGKKVVIITNTPRRAAVVAQEVARVGVTASFYDALVSAGEITHGALTARDGIVGAIGRRCFHVGPARSRPLIADCGLVEAADVDAADLILITGLATDGHRAEDYEADLARARRRGLPAVCANPDQVAVRAGVRGPAAGAVAARYAAMGGMVHNFGKPHAEIYAASLAAAAIADRARVLAVGDGLFTDIKGAADFGLDSLFVIGGIHAAELGGADTVDMLAIAAAAQREDAMPTWVTTRLRWSVDPTAATLS